MKKIFKTLIGTTALASAIVPTAVSLTSCNKNTSVEGYTDLLNVNDFSTVKIIEPITGDDAEWSIDVSSETEEAARVEKAYEKTVDKYIEINKNKLNKYFKQDLMYYFWKAMRYIKNDISAFQGTFNMNMEKLSIEKTDVTGHYLKANFTINYQARLTYNDYVYAPYEGYQTQVDVDGVLKVKNAYFNIHYGAYDETKKVATKPSFQFVACPELSTNPTSCESTGVGYVTYYDITGQQQTYELTGETITYASSVSEELIRKVYWEDPVFCLAIYWYKVLSDGVFLPSYSLQNVVSTIKTEA